MKLSVIIRAHNPRPDYFQRVLNALNAQTLAKDEWELLLIDNASDQKLADVWDLSWHFQARHIREDELGQAVAGRRGIRESKGTFLMFVDDDNLLPNTYLELAMKMAAEFPQLGAFGPGKIVGEFEIDPDPEIMPYVGVLAIRDAQRPAWSNFAQNNASTPWGAGLCFLRRVGLAYVESMSNDPIRRLLGRRGQEWLLSCEDVDMCLFACELGLGTGVFPELSLTHLISKRRLNPEYVISLIEAHTAANAILASLWRYPIAWHDNSLLAHIGHLSSLRGFARGVYLAERRGQSKARILLSSV